MLYIYKTTRRAFALRTFWFLLKDNTTGRDLYSVCARHTGYADEERGIVGRVVERKRESEIDGHCERAWEGGRETRRGGERERERESEWEGEWDMWQDGGEDRNERRTRKKNRTFARFRRACAIDVTHRSPDELSERKRVAPALEQDVCIIYDSWRRLQLPSLLE